MVHPFQRSCNLDDSYEREGGLTNGNEEPYTMWYESCGLLGKWVQKNSKFSQSICRNGATWWEH